MRALKSALIAVCFCPFLAVTAYSQPPQTVPEPQRKPVLIRDERTPGESQEEEAVEPDPFEAKRNLQVGDFYFKRKNFKAAVERYRDAVRYAPSHTKAYEKVIRALQKMEEFEEAAGVCRQFISTNPQSAQVPEFEARLKELETKLGTKP